MSSLTLMILIIGLLSGICLITAYYNRYVKIKRTTQEALNNYYNNYSNYSDYYKDYYDAYEILKKKSNWETENNDNKITFYLEIDDFDLHASEYKKALYPTAILKNNVIYINGVLWKPTVADFINKDYKNLKLLPYMGLTTGNVLGSNGEEIPAEIAAPTEEIY